MQIIEITENKSHISEVNIEPNVIKNRFDILYQNASNSIGGVYSYINFVKAMQTLTFRLLSIKILLN